MSPRTPPGAVTRRFVSPLGELVAFATATHLLALDFVDAPLAGHDAPGDSPVFARLEPELAAYFAGERVTWTVPLAPVCTPFQHRVWERLRAIPYGSTQSYGDLARALGDPGAIRAVGRANGLNPIAILVPCHRVIGSDGSLTGYAGGLERKRFLLTLEGALAAGLF